MQDLRIAAAQFEHRNNDKAYNLSRIRQLSRQAVEQGAQIVSFHECSITGYTFMQHLDRDAMFALAEPVPDGHSVRELIDIAREYSVIVMAGLIERAGDQLKKCYVTVGPDGFLARYHKLHAFINPHISLGDRYVVIDLLGWKVGFLICYDNNLPENVRATTLLGAQIIFMPHVTGCLPGAMPGRGAVDPALWHNRHRDPTSLRLEFQGRKGREWLMRWLPARAYENGVYAVFTNCIGVDDDTIKPGLSMILDPHGDPIAECTELGDQVVVGLVTADKLQHNSGRRYVQASRPELYGPLVAPSAQRPVIDPGWGLAYRRPPGDPPRA